VPFEIVPSGTQLDFISRRRICIAISLLMIAAGALAVLVRGGVPMGIDFTGGTELQLLFDEGVPVDDSRLRSVVAEAGIESATIVRFGAEGANEFLVKFPGGLDDEGRAASTTKVASRPSPESKARRRPVEGIASRGSSRSSASRSVRSPSSGSSSSVPGSARSFGRTAPGRCCSRRSRS